MKTIIKPSILMLTFALFGCATDKQVQSMDEHLQLAVTCPVGFKSNTSYSTTFYSTDDENKAPNSNVKTECVPEDLNKDRKMEWR